jgi:tRNA (cytidine/uridine-2'-O-)-methyltransferase
MIKFETLRFWIGYFLPMLQYQNIAEWMEQIPNTSRVFLMSSHAEKSYLEIEFQDEDWLVLEARD